LFNEYFYSVFTDSTILLLNLEEVSIPSNTISEVSFSLEDIFNELRSLQTSKAVGPDNTGSKILNNCADHYYCIFMICFQTEGKLTVYLVKHLTVFHILYCY